MCCLNYAVAQQKGELSFELSETNYGDHRVRVNSCADHGAENFNESNRNVIPVKCDTLDNLLVAVPKSFSSNISLMWIDVQGYEGYAFMGARNLLSKGIPVMAEIWPYGLRRAGMTQSQFRDIAESLWSNYWVMRRGKFVKYPIHVLGSFFDELGWDGRFDNLLFT